MKGSQDREMGPGDYLGHAFPGQGVVVLRGVRVGESFRRNRVPGVGDRRLGVPMSLHFTLRLSDH